MRFPPPPARTGAGFHEVSARYRDYAQVAAAAVVTLDDGGACTAAELVLLRVAPTPLRVDVSRRCVGTALDEAALAARRESLIGDSTRRTTSRSPARTGAVSPASSPAERCATPPSAPRARSMSRDTPLIACGSQVNGELARGRVEPRRTLADFLREDLDLTGTHSPASTASAATATCSLDGEAVRSCLMFAVQADGRSVETVEGLAGPRRHAERAAAGVHGAPRAAVRVLHARDAADRARVPARATRTAARDERDPRGDQRRHLPLHRLPADRRGDPAPRPRRSAR